MQSICYYFVMSIDEHDPFLGGDPSLFQEVMAASEVQLGKFERLAQDILKTQHPDVTRGYWYEAENAVLLFGTRFDPDMGADGFAAFVEVKDSKALCDRLRVSFGLNNNCSEFCMSEDDDPRAISGLIEHVRVSDKLSAEEYAIAGHIQELLHFAAGEDIKQTISGSNAQVSQHEVTSVISQLVLDNAADEVHNYTLIREIDDSISIVLYGLLHKSDAFFEDGPTADQWSTQFVCCDENENKAYLYRKNSAGQTFLQVLPLNEFDASLALSFAVEDLDDDTRRVHLGLDRPQSVDVTALEHILFRLQDELKKQKT
jgi:hypothetical protein